MSNKELIVKFYTAFSEGNSKAMIECYHEQIVFQDPAFGVLVGEKAKKMWEMLIIRSKGELKIEFKDIDINGDKGSAIWRANYFYGPKRRSIENHIQANFEFKEGLIIKHTDEFNLWKWSRQALGFSGLFLGWTSFMKKKIRKTSNSLLLTFNMKQNGHRP